MSKCEQCIIRCFNSLNSLETSDLKELTNQKTSKVIKKGEVLFDEGEHLNGIFCVKSGVCKVSKMSDNGKDQIIHLINKGSLIGERSLVNNDVSNLKATALNEMEVCFIPKKEFVKHLENNTDFTLNLLKNMASALKNADNVIVDMAQKSVRQRLAQALLYMNNRFHNNGSNDNDIDIQLSREDLANIIGTATESAIRLLSEFKKKNLIELHGKKITILNKEALQQVVNGH